MAFTWRNENVPVRDPAPVMHRCCCRASTDRALASPRSLSLSGTTETQRTSLRSSADWWRNTLTGTPPDAPHPPAPPVECGGCTFGRACLGPRVCAHCLALQVRYLHRDGQGPYSAAIRRAGGVRGRRQRGAVSRPAVPAPVAGRGAPPRRGHRPGSGCRRRPPPRPAADSMRTPRPQSAGMVLHGACMGAKAHRRRVLGMATPGRRRRTRLASCASTRAAGSASPPPQRCRGSSLRRHCGKSPPLPLLSLRAPPGAAGGVTHARPPPGSKRSMRSW